MWELVRTATKLVAFSCMVEGAQGGGATEQRAVLAPQHRPLLHGDNEACDIRSCSRKGHTTSSPLFADLGLKTRAGVEMTRRCSSPDMRLVLGPLLRANVAPFSGTSPCLSAWLSSWKRRYCCSFVAARYGLGPCHVGSTAHAVHRTITSLATHCCCYGSSVTVEK